MLHWKVAHNNVRPEDRKQELVVTSDSELGASPAEVAESGRSPNDANTTESVA